MSHKMLSQGVSVHGGNSQVSFSIIIALFLSYYLLTIFLFFTFLLFNFSMIDHRSFQLFVELASKRRDCLYDECHALRNDVPLKIRSETLTKQVYRWINGYIVE